MSQLVPHIIDYYIVRDHDFIFLFWTEGDIESCNVNTYYRKYSLSEGRWLPTLQIGSLYLRNIIADNDGNIYAVVSRFNEGCEEEAYSYVFFDRELSRFTLENPLDIIPVDRYFPSGFSVNSFGESFFLYNEFLISRLTYMIYANNNIIDNTLFHRDNPLFFIGDFVEELIVDRMGIDFHLLLNEYRLPCSGIFCGGFINSHPVYSKYIKSPVMTVIYSDGNNELIPLNFEFGGWVSDFMPRDDNYIIRIFARDQAGNEITREFTLNEIGKLREKSRLRNNGDTSVNGFLTLRVDRLNQNNEWDEVSTVVNYLFFNLAPVFETRNYIGLDRLWDDYGGFIVQQQGIYRINASFEDQGSNAIIEEIFQFEVIGEEIEEEELDLTNFPSEFTGNVAIVVGSESRDVGSDSSAAVEIAFYIQYNAEVPVQIFNLLSNEVDNPQAYNITLIGNPCDNSLINEVDETLSCENWNLPPGRALVRIVRNGNNMALIVGGTELIDTRRAAVAIRAEQIELSGRELILDTSNGNVEIID